MARGTFLRMAAVLGIAAAGHAGEGVIEINQAKALSGGVTFGDTPGFPVLLTDPGSYRLTSNLDVPANTTGIVVNIQDTTLDLNGFTISGQYVCCAAAGSGTGIQSPVARIKVINGGVQGFGLHGIQLGAFSHVEGIVVRHAGANGIELGGGSVALSNRVDRVGDSGLSFTGGTPGLYRDNVLSSSGRKPGSIATALSGYAHASGGNYCEDGSCSRRGARRFYLTTTPTNGDFDPSTACDVGFHFASIHELRDVTTLEYDARRGPTATGIDSAVGGPYTGSNGWGWIRTGFASPAFLSNNGEPGDADCSGWDVVGGASQGTRAKPTDTWDTPPLAAGNWETELVFCNTTNRLWCVED